MPRRLSILGNNYGRLMVIADAGVLNRRSMWACKCICGKGIVVAGPILTAGLKKSCGCLEKENQKFGSIVHGHAKKGNISKEFLAWTKAKYRCYQKKNKKYSDYGGRGIKMCDRWLESFQNFFDDMGPIPSSQHSLDRIDVNGNYEPENCRWATAKEQANNKRCNILVEMGASFILTLKQLSELTDLPYKNLYHRYKYRSQHPLEAVRELYEKRGLLHRRE